MRTFGLLLLALLTALPAAAQTPDTVAWRRYFPLAVGNVWEYEYLQEQPAHPYGPGYRYLWHERYAIVDRTVAGTDTLFTMLVYRRDSLSAQVRRDTLTVRYDSELTAVVDVETANPAPFSFGCGLAAPYEGGASFGRYCMAYGLPEPDFSAVAPSQSHKYISTMAGSGVWASDIGMTRGGLSCEGCTIFVSINIWTMRYAKVGGVEYGQRIVARETAERPEAAALRLWPNPSRGAVTVEAAPRAAVVAFDLLGREAVRTVAGADGRAALTLAPGVYVVAAGSQRQTLVVR